MKKPIFISILLLVFICACATTDQVRLNFVKTWGGKTVDDVISQFGHPSQELDDGQGGKMLIYGPATTLTIPDFQRQGSYFQGHELDYIF